MNRRQELWRKIPGLDKFEASTEGRIRNPDGLVDALKPRSNGSIVLMPEKGAGCKTFSVGRLVYITWIGEIPGGAVVYHKNGILTDARPGNLALRKKRSSRIYGKKGGGWNRRPVVKLNQDLTVVAAYRSAMEAARENGFDKYTIQRQVNLEIKSSVLAPDGYIYAWDDEKCLRKTMARAMRELEALGIRYTYPGTEEYWDLPPEVENVAPDLWLDAASLVGGATSECG